jgi:tetratricopeptide (TPR) repeat protein
MLETIREYAVEQLDARRDGARVRRRHAEHFLARAEALGAALGGEGVDEAYASFELEHDNFRAALAFTGAIGLVELRFRLASAVAHFWLVRGHLAEGRSWLEQTLAMQKGERIPPVVAAQVLRKLATLEWRQEDLDLADEHAQAALPLLDSANDDDERYRLLILLGCIDYSRRNPELARDWWEQSATLARSLENEAHLALALTNLAVVATELKDYAGAAAIYEESVASARRAENREYLAGALAGLGDMHLRLGEHEAGRAELIDSMALYAGLGFRDRVASCCIWLAPAPEHDGDNELAARLVGASFGIRNQTGSALDWQEREFVDELVPRVREALGAGGYDRAFAEGEAAPDEVVREVLASRVSTLGA